MGTRMTTVIYESETSEPAAKPWRNYVAYVKFDGDEKLFPCQPLEDNRAVFTIDRAVAKSISFLIYQFEPRSKSFVYFGTFGLAFDDFQIGDVVWIEVPNWIMGVNRGC